MKLVSEQIFQGLNDSSIMAPLVSRSAVATSGVARVASNSFKASSIHPSWLCSLAEALKQLEGLNTRKNRNETPWTRSKQLLQGLNDSPLVAPTKLITIITNSP